MRLTMDTRFSHSGVGIDCRRHRDRPDGASREHALIEMETTSVSLGLGGQSG